MEEKILCYIKRMHTGRDLAVSSPELERRFGLRGATLRKHINTLRCRGYPICSDESGYYYAASYVELSDTIRQLNSRIVKIAQARNGLIRAGSAFPDESGQISLPLS